MTMKGWLWGLALVFSSGLWGAPAKLVTVPISTIVPAQFDEGEEVRVVVAGRFLSTCFELSRCEVEIDHEARRVALRQRAFQFAGSCAQLVVPFSQVAELGSLRRGEYVLTDDSSGRELGMIEVGY